MVRKKRRYPCKYCGGESFVRLEKEDGTWELICRKRLLFENCNYQKPGTVSYGVINGKVLRVINKGESNAVHKKNDCKNVT